MTAPVHVLDEPRSPADGQVWHMLCGASCVAFDDGECCPELDFVLPRFAARASCIPCLRALTDARVRDNAEMLGVKA